MMTLNTKKPPNEGTRIIEDYDQVVAPEPEEVAWIHVNNFMNNVRPEKVESLARDGLQCEEPIKAFMLVKRGVDPKGLKRISFKVGVDVKYRDKALLSSTWPKGIKIRDFVDFGRDSSAKNSSPSGKNTPLRKEMPVITISPAPPVSQYSTPEATTPVSTPEAESQTAMLE